MIFNNDAFKKISTIVTPAKKTDKCEKEEKGNHKKKQQTLDMCVTKSDALKAEIIWASVYSFDKSLNVSLNGIIQTCEMDVYICNWDVIDNQVNVSYWDQLF